MWRRFALPMLLLCLTCLPAAGQAPVSASGLIAPNLARQHGLKRAWYAQVALDRARSRVEYVTLHVSMSHTYQAHQVVHPGGTMTFTERDVDRYGRVVGPERARQAAVAARTELGQGGAATLNSFDVPEVTLYAQTTSGMLHAIDGETGKTRWAVQVGSPAHPCMQPGANDQFVASVNGSRLYLMDRADGKLVGVRKMTNGPGAGPALSQYMVFVPTLSGELEAYQLDNIDQPPSIYKSSGRTMVPPIATPNSVCWSTDYGYLYVGHSERTGIRYRMETSDAIVTHATYQSPNRLFATSIDGFCYCLQEFSGDVVWRFSAGDPISHPPIVVGDAVYVVADQGGMYRVGVQDGRAQWWTPRTKKFLAGSERRVYALNNAGRIEILDAASGGRVAMLPTEQLDLMVTNWFTDRIYVGSATGLIQCLHEAAIEYPVIHAVRAEDARRAPPEEEPAEAVPVEQEPPPADDVDPFGEQQPGQEEDPFGAGGADDPFGAGGDDDSGNDDPFGGNDDPFG